MRAHSLADAPVAAAGAPYPVVVLRGGASAEVWNYTSLAEDLASHGYVVVGVDAPGRTNVVAFGDGRVVRRAPENDPELALGAPDSAQRINRVLGAWVRDLGVVLDRLQRLDAGAAPGGVPPSGVPPSGPPPGAGPSRWGADFTGRLDLGRVGVVGHSLGGATALQFCHDDARCRAAVDIDGAPLGPVVREGVPRPTLFLLSDHRGETGAESRRILATLAALYDRLPPNQRAWVMIPGAQHFLFSDDGALLKSHLVQRTLRAFGVLGMDGRDQLATTAITTRRFLDRYVGAPHDGGGEGAHAPTPQ